MTVQMMIVVEYGGKDGGKGRAAARSRNPFVKVSMVSVRLWKKGDL